MIATINPLLAFLGSSSFSKGITDSKALLSETVNPYGSYYSFWFELSLFSKSSSNSYGS